MRMPFVRCGRGLLGGYVLVVLVAATWTVPASADPITLSSVQALWIEPNGELARVDLLASPGAILWGQEVDFGTESRAVVSFDAFITGSPGEGADTLRATFSLPSGSPPPFSNLVQQASLLSVPGVYVFGLDFPLLYHPVPMSLTLDLLQGALPGRPVSSTTVTFSVVQPVPEPSALALVTLGLAVLVLASGRRMVLLARRLEREPPYPHRI
jgi:uncharacterized protein YhhL (DUF1145 family)